MPVTRDCLRKQRQSILEKDCPRKANLGDFFRQSCLKATISIQSQSCSPFRQFPSGFDVWVTPPSVLYETLFTGALSNIM